MWQADTSAVFQINKYMQEYARANGQLIQLFVLDIVHSFSTSQVEQLGKDLTQFLFSLANIVPGVKRKKN